MQKNMWKKIQHLERPFAKKNVIWTWQGIDSEPCWTKVSQNQRNMK
jgi:hypothetical protein